MFVGDTDDGSGALHLALELVANAIDQHLAGERSRIAVEQADDGTVTVSDDGTGIADPASRFEIPSSMPTVDGHRPHVHLGIGGAGLFVVNALAERLEIVTVRDGRAARAVYARGLAVEPWRFAPTATPSGTAIRMKCDREIFSTGVPRDRLDDQLEVLAYLLPKLAFGRGHDGRGLALRVASRARCELADVAHASETADTPGGPIDVDVALAACGELAHVESFANLRRTRSGGRHVDGMFDGVRRVLGGGQRDRIVAVVSVILTDVKWGAPTQDLLLTDAVRKPVADVTERALRNSRLVAPR